MCRFSFLRSILGGFSLQNMTLNALVVVSFLVSTFTPLGAPFLIVGLVMGLWKGYWLILWASLAGIFCQIVIKFVAALARGER